MRPPTAGHACPLCSSAASRAPPQGSALSPGSGGAPAGAHLGAVLGDEEELGEGAVQREENARLCHVLQQAVLHLGEQLPQGLQQREVTEVAVGGGADVRPTPADSPPTPSKVITLPPNGQKDSPAANRERGRTQASEQGSKGAGDPKAQARKSAVCL